LVERLWPPSLREASLGYFSLQPLADGGTHFPSNPRAVLERIHGIQVGTPLRTVVAWQLDRSADTRDAAVAARRHGRRGPALDYEDAVQALANRDFAAAARDFARASDAGAGERTALYYRLYALAMAGHLDEVRSLATREGVVDGAHPDDGEVWAFLASRFPALAGEARADPDPAALAPRGTDPG